MSLSSNPQRSLRCADNIRILAAAMVEKANSGHPGGPMGGADFMHILYSEYLNYDPDDMGWHARDRFFLDAGHMSAMLYACQSVLGNYSMDDLMNFRQWKSPTPGHPEVDVKRGIENTSGPLGLGHAFGAGAAITERFLVSRFGKTVEHKTYLYISDGGIQEEISQGVGRIAGHLGLGQIIMFYDANDVQLSTVVDAVTSEDTAMKYRSWNWHVTEIDGNNHDAIREALDASISESDRPSLIIGKTVMGKGVLLDDGSSFEGEVELHGQPLGKSNASFDETIKGLGADPGNPFMIFDDVASYYSDVLNKKREDAQARKRIEATWKASNPDLSALYAKFLNKDLSHLDWSAIEQKADTATRNSSGAVLAYLADHLPNMIVSSADLCNSDKTEFFLKKSSAFKKGDFSGAFLQSGVSELTMTALCTGMALHGGVVPVCATFFAFSDYQKPAIRVAALMEQQVIFIWTHDAFRVGEDGPTHQPIEQESQIRLLEHVKNHSGTRSFLALRPADGQETTVSWRIALEEQGRPSGLILSRQGIKDIQAQDRGLQAYDADKGAYLVYDCGQIPQAILIGNGSEVSTLMEGMKLLADDGIHVNVVSIPSIGLFLDQDDIYKKSLLPADTPRFGLTAGLAYNLEGIVGDKGTVHGLNHFGYSAPYKVLDEKFGFTGENVRDLVKTLIR